MAFFEAVVDLFEQVYFTSFVFFIGVWHEDVKLILIFVHVTATVSPIPSPIPTNVVGPTSVTVVAVAVAVPAAAAVLVTGITTLHSSMYYVHSYIIHLLTALGYVCQFITALGMNIFLFLLQ